MIPAIGTYLIAGGLLIGAAGGAVWYIKHQQQERDTLEYERNDALIKAQVSASLLDGTRKQLEHESALRVVAEAKVTELQKLSAERVAIFNRHRFGVLLQAKPGLMEKRMNDATERVWAEIQAEAQ